MKKVLLTLVVAIMVTSQLFAVEAEVNGINYNFTKLSKTAEVIALSSGKYTGSVVIPATVVYDGTTYNVTSIGGSAFYYCTGLTAVTIPNSVTSIGEHAFYECTRLISVTIPNSVTSIGDYAFYNCSSLTSITIPSSVTSIGNYAFLYCSGLTSITIPSSVTSIGSGAFQYCTGLTSITIPNSVMDISNNAFSDCTSLTSVTIPSSVTSIGEGAFYGCTGLTSVVIPNSVTSIGGNAFRNCTGLTSVTIPSSVTSIGARAFYNCASLTSITIPNSVTSIGYSAFSGCSGLTSVVIPNSVTSIGGHAFRDCTGLTSVNIGDGVTSIGESDFYGCSGLTSITIPNSVTSIGHYAFEGCSSLTYATLGFSVSSIGFDAFKDCESLESITCLAVDPPSCSSNALWILPQYSLLNVPCGSEDDYRSQWGFTNVQTIEGSCPSSFPENQKIYYTSSDGNKINLYNKTKIYDGPATTGHVEYSPAFNAHIIGHSYADGQWCLVFDTILTSIEYRVFYRCSTLASITIPNSVTSIGPGTFQYCTGLTSISIPNSVTSIGNNTFYSCTGLTSITIPNSVTSIGNYAFYGCSGLTSITIPESVTSIGDNAFYNCSGLTSVNIGDGVTSIGANAFNKCTNVTSITCEATTPPNCGSWCFYNVSTSIPVYVPCASVAAYKAAAEWSTFTNIQLIEGTCFGQCGDSLYWSLDDGVLTITGTGDMYDYNDSNNKASWRGVTFTSVLFPEGMTSIGNYAFKGCSGLTSVTIPNSVTSIGANAFYNCSGLMSIICKATTPPTCGSSSFSDVKTSIPVYVPCDAVSAYQAAEEWSAFTNIQPIDGTCPIASQCGDSLYWSIENDTLFITGIGDMYSYGYTSNVAPWQAIPFTHVVLPEGLTSIGWYAFANCSDLTSVTVPESVEHVYPFAFYGCSSLTSVVWNARNIDSSDLIINNQVYPIFDQTNPTITSFTFGENVLVIPPSLCGNQPIQTITIPASVNTIHYFAFAGCTSLTSITCEATSIPYCAYGCFDGISSSVPVYVPCALAGIYQEVSPWNTFSNIQPIAGSSCERRCGDSLYWDYADSTLTITGTGAMYDLDYPIWDNLPITSVSLPEGLTHVGDWAFFYCSGLTSIVVPNSVTSIGKHAFQQSGITSISLPSSLANIDTQAFASCIGLTSITIPNSVKSIGIYAFVGCNNLTSITIPETVEHVFAGAFEACYSLESVTWNAPNVPSSDLIIDNIIYPIFGEQGMSITSFVLGEGVVNIPVALCYNLPIQQITIPASVELVDSYAFAFCSNLTSITCKASVPPTCGNYTFHNVSTSIPVYVPCTSVSAYQAANGWSDFTNIQPIDGTCAQMCGDNLYWSIKSDTLFITGTGAMYDYQDFTNPSPWYGSTIYTLSLPDGLTHIGDYAFLDCSSLTAVSIPNSVTSLGEYAFGYCTDLQSIVIPTSITSLGNRVFSGCSGLTSVTLPNSLTSIGDGTFAGCQALTSISIPGGVTSIGAYAFTACFGLSSITCKAMIPPTCGTDCFASVSKTIPVYVPCTSVAAYQTAEGWSMFTNIQPIEGSCDAEEITDPVEEVVVEPAVNTVTITWPNVSDANTYVLEITKNGEVICRLTFNSMGQLIGIAFAPNRNGTQPARAAQAVVGGWQFTVTGLEAGTRYDYVLTVTDGQQPIATHTGSFVTDRTTNLESQMESSTEVTKFLRDGLILIQRGGNTYDLRGQMVK